MRMPTSWTPASDHWLAACLAFVGQRLDELAQIVSLQQRLAHVRHTRIDVIALAR